LSSSLSDFTRAYRGWAVHGRTASFWFMLWFFLAYAPTVLSYATYLYHRPDLATVTAALVTWWPGLVSSVFGIAFLLAVTGALRSRIAAYTLATFYFLFIVMVASPRQSLYLLPHFMPSDDLVSEFAGFGDFAAVLYLQRIYVVALILALLALGVYLVSLRRRPAVAGGGVLAAVFLLTAFGLGSKLAGQPSQSEWVARNRENGFGRAVLVGAGHVPPGHFGYGYEGQVAGVRFVAFRGPSSCQLRLLSVFVQAGKAFPKRTDVLSAVEAAFLEIPFYARREGILVIPERVRFERAVERCERQAIGTFVEAFFPAVRPSLQEAPRDDGQPEKALRALRKNLELAEERFVNNLLAQWYLVHQLFGPERLRAELVLWRRASRSSSGPAARKLRELGAVGSRLSIPGRGLLKALEEWKRLGVEGVRLRIERALEDGG